MTSKQEFQESRPDQATGSQQHPQQVMLEDLIGQLNQIRSQMIKAVNETAGTLQHVHPDFQASARNLIHYLVLRRRDLRPLQARLAELGLSSLGRSEAHVLATIEAVLGTLRRLVRDYRQLDDPGNLDFRTGQELLQRHTEILLGPIPSNRNVHIMVTMPGEAAVDYSLVRELLNNGMNCMRINCAHDDARAWSGMIGHLRRAQQVTGKTCRILMDLAGPKLRTGPISRSPGVIKIRPTRDTYGQVLNPARIWLGTSETWLNPPAVADCSLPLPANWLGRIKEGDRIRLIENRGAKRILRVIGITEGGVWVETDQTCYVTADSRLSYRRGKGTVKTRPGEIPEREIPLILVPGDALILTRDSRPGKPARRDHRGRLLAPARIGCTLPEALQNVAPGDAIWFDDGVIGGKVESVSGNTLRLRIIHTRGKSGKLRGGKGLNLPDTRIELPAITSKDIQDLEFIARHADMVALSFANHIEDIRDLHRHLQQIGGQRPGIVIKVETRAGFENLPAMLLEAMADPVCGVMIARGDLAVESGFERLAEVQEEILWLCEAAHVPAIWATQVLESLAKDGAPTRAEITDAAMGHRAECVMLNKGDHIIDAVRTLHNILVRMETHQIKKQSMLRELRLAYSLPT